MNRCLLNGAGLAFAFALGIAEVPAQQRTTTPENQRTTTPEAQRQTQPAQSQQATQTGTMTSQSFVQQAAQWNDGEIELARLAMTRARSDDVKDYAEDLIKDHTKANDKLREYATKNGFTLRVSNTSSSTSASTSSSSTSSSTRTPQGSELSPAERAPQRSESGQPGRGDSSSTQAGQPGQQGRTDSSTTRTPATGATAASQQQPTAQEQTRELSAKSAAEFDKSYIQMMVDNHQRAVTMYERQHQTKLGDKDLQEFIEDELDRQKDHLEKAREIQTDLDKDLGFGPADK